MAPTILLIGFEPFGDETVNPSWEVARRLDGEVVAGARIVARAMPCVFGQSLVVLDALLTELEPVMVLALGQAGGRCDLSLERVAINVNDARMPDNAGAQPVDEAVVAGGPVAYFSSLPIKAMVAGLRAAGFPASVSQSAGTFVCNHVFYALQHRLAASAVRSGFMHIPYLPEQAARHPGQPSLPLATVESGVRLALALAMAHAKDLRLGGGTDC